MNSQAPGSLDTAGRYLGLGIREYNGRNVGQAAAYFRLALQADPQSDEARLRLAMSISEAGGTEEAVELLRETVISSPEWVKPRHALGILLKKLGNFAEAAEHFKAGADLEPESAMLLCLYASCKKFEEKDRPLLEQLKTILADATGSLEQRRAAGYELGRAFDVLGEYREAIGYFEEANRLDIEKARASGRTPNLHKADDYIDSMTSWFESGRLRPDPQTASKTKMPIFIVGMVRSGTTLLEQILTSHPQVGSAGELNFWQRHTPTKNYSYLLDGKGSASQVTDLCSEYRQLLRRSCADRAKIIDKMPLNYFTLGPIHLMMPNARIVHCRRNPIDTCLSIFCTQFGDPVPEFALGKSNIVKHYKQYLRLMELWRAYLPADRFLEIDYEDVVADREPAIRRLLQFLDLEWDDRCLEHEKNAKAVSTPSLWQVRQPIYSSSVERWRNYEPWLEEFADLNPQTPSDSFRAFAEML